MSLYYINQNFSFRDRFTIKNDQQEDIFFAEGELLSFGKRIKLRAMDGEELLLIKEKVFTFLSQYDFYIADQLVGEMKKEISFFKARYKMVHPNWTIQGDLWSHNYEIKEGNQLIAVINKKIFSFMDAYEIEVYEDNYVELVLGIVIAIDADLAKEQNS